MFGFVQGQTVKTTRDVRIGWLTQTTVRKGTRGIVIGRAGLFGSSYRVSFPQGNADISGRHLRASMSSPGCDLHAGFRLGKFIFFVGLPAIAALRYWLSGGSLTGIVAALPAAILGMLLDVACFGLRHLGVWGILAALLALWVWLRSRRR